MIRRGGGSRELVLATLEELRREKERRRAALPMVRLNFALQADNLEELVPLVESAPELGAASLYVQYLDYVEMDDRKGPLVEGLTRDALERVFRRARETCRRLGITHNLDIWLRDLDLYVNKMGPPESFRPNRRVCWFPWISTFIEANGDVKPCPIFVWKRGVGRMGNLGEEEFRAIWHGGPYREVRRALRRGERIHAPCRQCIPQSLGNIYNLFTKLHPGWNRRG
jgi:radical SAM protein with 4Fe4S-binding SPASM domain